MDLSLKEALGLMISIMVGAMVIGAFLHFSLFQNIINIFEGVM